ncbi:MAG: hypothetical protein CL570_03635 [Alphaproteobacteria bacterium]|nr:hypothetical protein [Alphaproteobacteria bacterium]HCQ70687.1 hypothetical protein [Rhodospirillaceae bacterium]|tara:strand:+ start:4569 stop:4913 length:345 start_codon:yes stop_codon:yes gene_type:complete
MMKFLFLLLLIPAAAAMGHDTYLYYIGKNANLDFSALGFLWTQYHPSSFEYVASNLPEDIWAQVNPILSYPALYVALVFAAIMFTLIWLITMPFRKKADKDFSFSAQKKWNRGG